MIFIFYLPTFLNTFFNRGYIHYNKLSLFQLTFLKCWLRSTKTINKNWGAWVSLINFIPRVIKILKIGSGSSPVKNPPVLSLFGIDKGYVAIKWSNGSKKANSNYLYFCNLLPFASLYSLKHHHRRSHSLLVFLQTHHRFKLHHLWTWAFQRNQQKEPFFNYKNTGIKV